MTKPRDFDAIRIVSRASGTPHKVPQTIGNEAIYKGELVVNHAKENNNLIASSAGLFLRVGGQLDEDVTDSVIHIGNAYVTEDPATAVQPGITFTGNVQKLVQTGKIWYRKTDKTFFINDGTGWSRLTPVNATSETAGLVRIATQLEIVAGSSNSTAISPLGLKEWSARQGFVSRRTVGNRIYVDTTAGDDSIENDGLDPSTPFLTPERAALQVALNSFKSGSGNAVNANYVIVLRPGEYYVDNRPGAASYLAIARTAANATGPINKQVLTNKVTAFDLPTLTVTISQAQSEGVLPGQQVFSSSGGRGIVSSVTDTQLVLRQVKGTWAVGDTVSYPNYSVFNPPDGGMVLPRGCSLIAEDPTKTVLRPRYTGKYALWVADSACLGTGRTALLRLTGGSYVKNITAADSPFFLETHHLCSAFTLSSVEDLTHPEYGYYLKVFQSLGLLKTGLTFNDVAALTSEYIIGNDTSNNQALDELNLLLVNGVNNFLPTVDSCMVKSRWGMQGISVDGSKVRGFKQLIANAVTVISLQNDGRAYDTDLNAPGGKRYKPEWLHNAFEGTKDAVLELTNCYVACAGKHYVASEGAELSLVGCRSSYGAYSLVADGFSNTALAQDKGFKVTAVLPPKPITDSLLKLPILPFKLKNGANKQITTPVKLYLDEEPTQDRITPFEYAPGEKLYVLGPDGIEYSASLALEAPLVARDDEGWYFNTSPVNNLIYQNKENLVGRALYIKRAPDLRTKDDRLYWLKIVGTGAVTQRTPLLTSVMVLSTDLMGKASTYGLVTTLIKTTDTSGMPLPENTYYVAFTAANTAGPRGESIYPPRDPNVPNENSPNSLTYIAVEQLLTDLGYNLTQRLRKLQPANQEIPFTEDIFVEFRQPSTLKANAHYWAWPGYGNYSSALSPFQLSILDATQAKAVTKYEKYGGRVFATGMDKEGNVIVGNKLTDLKTGTEVLADGTEGTTLEILNQTITDSLVMLPGSELDLRSARISVNSLTDLAQPIPADGNWKLYAKEDKAGFVELASLAEALQGQDNVRAMTPATTVALFRQLLAQNKPDGGAY